MSVKRAKYADWSSEDDELLRKQIHTHGLANWKIVASTFNGDKSSRQCRHRWTNFLRVSRKGPWTLAEDQLLIIGHAKYGNKWTKVCTHFCNVNMFG